MKGGTGTRIKFRRVLLDRMAHKVPISQECINIIAERCKGDRKNLYNELSKIENLIKIRNKVLISALPQRI